VERLARLRWLRGRGGIRRISGIESMQATSVPLMAALAMLAFAGNSRLCRLALQQTAIDAASFTSAISANLVTIQFS